MKLKYSKHVDKVDTRTNKRKITLNLICEIFIKSLTVFFSSAMLPTELQCLCTKMPRKLL